MNNKKRIHAYRSQKTKAPNNKRYFFLFIFMILSISVFFFGYQQYQRISKNYHRTIIHEEWVTESSNISQNLPATFLVVGMSFADSGRIEVEQSIVWRLITINPTSQKTLIAEIAPTLEINNLPLLQYRPIQDKEGVVQSLEDTLGTPIDYYNVIHLSDVRPIVDHVGGLLINANQTIQLEDISIMAGQDTLLSSRQVLQYILQQVDDSILTRSKRNGEVMTALWQQFEGLNNPLLWNDYFQNLNDVLYSSVEWMDFIKLFIGSYANSMEQIEYMEITEDTLASYQQKIKEYTNVNQ